ncbi:MAG: hypothetical protein IKC10_01375 [Alphaproteobacteria bacterium]|nr:hypothetical protein [Alphaproteobacteria bacterium]
MKSYDEIANSVFERRNKYIAAQKKKKRIIVSIVVPALCCCIVIITSFGLWKSGFFSSNIPVTDNSQSMPGNSNDSSDKNDPSSTTNSNYSSQDKDQSNNSSQGGFIPNNSTPSNPDENPPSTSSEETPSTFVPPVTEANYNIDSIDKINFYSAKKIISENSFFPLGMRNSRFSAPKMISLNNIYTENPIDRNKIFTTTMVTYFTIELNDEKGFLAQKLGGTGLVEVVVTQNDIDDLGKMITFKRADKYYTCLANGGDYDPDTNNRSHEFSSHKYIDGFNIIKNLEQENYKFTVHYEGSKVTGFECAPFRSVPENYAVDDVTFIEDFCVVLYTKQTFTIDELEVFLKNEKEEESL